MRLPRWVRDLKSRDKEINKVLRYYKPEYKIGSGAYKFVYKSRDNAVSFTYCTTQLKYELKALQRLESIGLDIVKIKKTIITKNCGIVIMKMYFPITSKTEYVKQECYKMATILKNNKLIVDDLQVMIDKNTNKLVIMDPLYIRRTRKKEEHTFWFKGGRGFAKSLDIFL